MCLCVFPRVFFFFFFFFMIWPRQDKTRKGGQKKETIRVNNKDLPHYIYHNTL